MGGNRHRVHFSYWLHAGVWHYRFIGEGITLLGPLRRTRNPETIRGIADRGGGLFNLEANLMFDLGIKSGQGDMYLWLTEDQYAAITNKS